MTTFYCHKVEKRSGSGREIPFYYCLLISYVIASFALNVQAQGNEFCSLDEHLDTDKRKLKAESPYKWIISKVSRGYPPRQSASLSGSSNFVPVEEEELFLVSDELQDQNTAIALFTPGPDRNEPELAFVNSIDDGTSKNLESSLGQHLNSIKQLVSECDLTGNNNQMLLAMILPAVNKQKEVDKMVEAARRIVEIAEDVDPQTPKLAPALDNIEQVRQCWHCFYSVYNVVTSYGKPFMLSFSVTSIMFNLLSVTYGSTFIERFAVYHDMPSYNFTGCEVNVQLKTNRLLIDLYKANITNKLHEGFDSVGDIIQPLDPLNTVIFQTTGRFAGFMTHAVRCRCPLCPGVDYSSNNDFDSCLIDVSLKTDVLRASLLELVRGNSSDRLPTDISLMAHFYSFESVGNSSPGCGCTVCPKVQTSESERQTSGILFVFDIMGGAILAIVPTILYSLYMQHVLVGQ